MRPTRNLTQPRTSASAVRGRPAANARTSATVTTPDAPAAGAPVRVDASSTTGVHQPAVGDHDQRDDPASSGRPVATGAAAVDPKTATPLPGAPARAPARPPAVTRTDPGRSAWRPGRPRPAAARRAPRPPPRKAPAPRRRRAPRSTRLLRRLAPARAVAWI